MEQHCDAASVKSAHISTGMNGTSTGMSGTSTGMSGTSTGMNGTSTGMNGTSTGMSGTSTGMNGTSTGMSGASGMVVKAYRRPAQLTARESIDALAKRKREQVK